MMLMWCIAGGHYRQTVDATFITAWVGEKLLHRLPLSAWHNFHLHSPAICCFTPQLLSYTRSIPPPHHTPTSTLPPPTGYLQLESRSTMQHTQ